MHNTIKRLILGVLAACTLLPAIGWGQSQAVSFDRAYLRDFLITNCSNANPIVVTIQTPVAADDLSFVPLDAGSLVTISGVSGNTACNVSEQAINVLTATTFELTGVAGNGAYTVGGYGITDTISTATTPSPPLSNVGQSGHLVSVEFPTAVGTVTPIQVRLEAADTCPDPPFCSTGDWKPIQSDVTEVISVGGIYYQFAAANGTWRALRINSIAATPTSLPMRVDYTGTPFPLGAIINNGDSFTILSPFSSGPGNYEFVAGSCQDGTAGLAFNGPAPLPEASCVSDDQTLAVAGFDDTTTEAVEDSFVLPGSGTPTTTELRVIWESAAAGTVQWSIATACVGPGDILGSINYSAATTVTGTSAGSVDTTITDFPTIDIGCNANDILFWQFSRTGGVGTLVGDALLKSLVFNPAQ